AADALAASETTVLSPDRLMDVQAEIRAAINEGTSSTTKALLQALVEVVTVEGRHAIQPVFRVPNPAATPDDAKVRELSRLAPSAGFEPAHPPPEGGALSPELRGPVNPSCYLPDGGQRPRSSRSCDGRIVTKGAPSASALGKLAIRRSS